MSKKTLETSFEKILNNIRDIYFYLPYIKENLNEYADTLETISLETEKFTQTLREELPIVLIALKLYTEGKVSWERAGELSDLHIYGLRQYCTEKDVEYGHLRVDEYYGFKGDEAVKIIEKEWQKLDPNGIVAPVQYSGDSLYVKYPTFEEKSKNENLEEKIDKEYYQFVGREELTQLLRNYHKFLEPSQTKSILEICKGLEILNSDELFELRVIISNSIRLFRRTASRDEFYEYLISQFQDNYYNYTIKKKEE